MALQFEKKGALVLPIAIFSSVLVFLCFGLISRWLGLKEIKHIQGLLGGISMFIAGIVNYFASKNYFINTAGEREYYEAEGTFLYIKVRLWTRIFLTLGVLITLSTLADIFRS